MRKFLGCLAGAVLGLVCAAGSQAQQTAAQAPVEVLIIEAYHMANPGRDLNNVKADDVLSAKRQAELEAVARGLTRFRPTKVAVELEPKTADFTVPGYRTFGPEMLATDRSEVIQIGFRLAKRMGHPAVYGVDEKPGPGEPDYFPYGQVAKYAAEHGRGEWLKGLSAPVRKMMADFETAQATSTIGQLLDPARRPGLFDDLHASGYYGLLELGDAERQPGAELNAMWYLRNAKIFSKLIQATEPGDRVVLIFGGGHGYWLKHFARTTPGFKLVDASPYLQERPQY
jgi:hypothetical protein